MQEQWIVAEDLERRYLEGEVIDGVKARQAESWGAVVLPVDLNLMARSGIGGYYRRAWGAGLQLDGIAPHLLAPITLFLAKENARLLWRARLVPGNEVRQRIDASEDVTPTFEGFLRIASDSAQDGPRRMGLTAKQSADMRSIDAHRLRAPAGVVVGGEAAVLVP